MKKNEETPKIVTELTPELADKIWKSIQRKMYNDRVSKDAVLHHLKQLKAEFGKLKKKSSYQLYPLIYEEAITDCMGAIDNKINKIK